MYVIISRVRLQCRGESKKVMAKGIFEKAVVVRGRDWMWKNQDGWFLCVHAGCLLIRQNVHRIYQYNYIRGSGGLASSLVCQI